MFALIDITTNNILLESEDRDEVERLLQECLKADRRVRKHLKLVEAKR